MLAFQEMGPFSRKRDEYFGGDDGFREFQNELLKNPRKGNVWPGIGHGVRKVRFAEPSRGKGKRGGGRAVYIYVEEVSCIILITVYDKDDTEDLSHEEKKKIAELAQEVRADILEFYGTNK